MKNITFVILILCSSVSSFGQADYYSCQSYYDGFDETFTLIRLRDESLYANGYLNDPDEETSLLSRFQLHYIEVGESACDDFVGGIPWWLTDEVSTSIYLLKNGSYIDTLTENTIIDSPGDIYPFLFIDGTYTLSDAVVADDDYQLRFEIIVTDVGHDFEHIITTDQFVIMDPVYLVSPETEELDVDFVTTTFSWNRVDSASFYCLYISDDPLYSGGSCNTLTPPDAFDIWITDIEDTVFEVTDLSPDTYYTWAVWAIQFDECATKVDHFTTRGLSVPIIRFDFYETVTANMTNPKNLVNVGDSIRFNVQVFNELGTNLPTLNASLSSLTPGVSIIDDEVNFNNLESGESGWSTDHFEIYVEESVPKGTILSFELSVEDEIITGDPWESTFSFPVEPIVADTILLDDDNNPDSDGDNDDIPEPGEVIELLPTVKSVTSEIFHEVSGILSCDNESIYIWDEVMGVSEVVYDSIGYNFSFGDQIPILPDDFLVLPEFDFVFEYDESGFIEELNFELEMRGYLSEESGLYWDEGGILMKWGINQVYHEGITSPAGLKNENSETFKLYHSDNTIHIIYTEYQNNMEVEVYNFLGQLVGSKSFTNTHHGALGVNIANGIYTVLVRSDGVISTELISVKN